MLEELVPLNPANFFAFEADCYEFKGKKGEDLKDKYLLPDLSTFHGDLSFAKVSLAWSTRGIFCHIHVDAPLKESRYPDFQVGDAVELFFDTRDVKTSALVTRFCHHFFFLSQPVETEDDRIVCGEMTRFRADDAHDLCSSSSLQLEVIKGKKDYTLKIFIPSECLFGYDPSQFNRLGFTYRIHSKGRSSQFFSTSDEDFTTESHPFLWASLQLKT